MERPQGELENKIPKQTLTLWAQEHFKFSDKNENSEAALTTIMSGRGFSYSKLGRLSANLIVKVESVDI